MASPGNRHCANCIDTLSFPMDSRLKGHGFDSWPFRFRVTTLGKLFTCMCF